MWTAGRHPSPLFAQSRAIRLLRLRDVEHRLPGIVFPSGEELLAGIYGVLGEIPLETFAHAFHHWMERLKWVSENNGGSSPEPDDSLISFFSFPIRDRDAKREWNTLELAPP
jgi:hypothetical protein